MKVHDSMTRDVRIASPSQTLLDAARIMAELDIGILPVAENDRLVGMITDRDIVVRGLAAGRSPETPLREVMSPQVQYCFEDQSIEEITANMGDIQVRRLPVVNRDKRLVGIISIGDIAMENGGERAAGAALSGISRPGGEHSQCV